jgi:hypothetical protein
VDNIADTGRFDRREIRAACPVIDVNALDCHKTNPFTLPVKTGESCPQKSNFPQNILRGVVLPRDLLVLDGSNPAKNRHRFFKVFGRETLCIV